MAARGIDSSLIGTVTRPDGTKQITLNGWPLYLFAGDSRPGELSGEGVDGTWHAVAPNGKTAAANNNGGGYGDDGYGG